MNKLIFTGIFLMLSANAFTEANYKEINKNSYDVSAKEYQENTKNHSLTEVRAERFLSYLSPNAKILDLGCGPGKYAKCFTGKGCSVIGIDLSSKMIELAKKAAPEAEFYVMDIEEFSFPERSFDAVWAAASLLHIPKQTLPSVLDKIHLYLKPQGVFYVSMKKGAGEILKPDERYGGIEKFWNYVSEEEFVDLLTEHGFQILEQSTHEIENAYQTHPWITVICSKQTQ